LRWLGTRSDNTDMQVTIELPEGVAELLAELWGGDSQDVSRAVLEAVVVTAVRDARLSRAQGRQMLGVSRYEMDGVLSRHGIGSWATVESVEQDTAAALAFMAE
jgi:hypothetical protein